MTRLYHHPPSIQVGCRTSAPSVSLVARATRSPGKEPWMRLEGFARADQVAARRKQRRANKLMNKALKKRARPDTEEAIC